MIKRDILEMIGKFSDYRSFINLLKTCKEFYRNKKTLEKKIFEYIEYTNFTPMMDFINIATKEFYSGNMEKMKKFYEIGEEIPYELNQQYIYITKESFYGNTEEYLKGNIPDYQVEIISFIIETLYLFIVDPNKMILLNGTLIDFDNVIFVIGNLYIIHRKHERYNQNIIIDIQKIITYNNTKREEKKYCWKYIMAGMIVLGGIYAICKSSTYSLFSDKKINK